MRRANPARQPNIPAIRPWSSPLRAHPAFNKDRHMSKRPADSEGFGAAPHERPVPRISIHAFCEFPDTGAALQRAGADRRLSKAHLTVQLGGIAAAVEYYRGQVT